MSGVEMYSNEKNAQIIVALLKEHGIRKVIASPGNTNFSIVGSMQADSYFEMYSSVDERSAAYMACGMAASSGEPVVISCTGATASRNYLSGLTEAYYRKLPVIAITSFNGNHNLGQMMPQNLDRTVIQRDVALTSVQVPVVKDAEDAAYVNRVVNEALLECVRDGGGPVHINVCCNYAEGRFETKELPDQRLIQRYGPFDEFPDMGSYGKIAVFIGAHVPLSNRLEEALEGFSRSRNVCVLCDHTSNFHGSRAALSPLAAENTGRWAPDFAALRPDLVIDIGETSGDYVTVGFLSASKTEVWRVSPDGEVRDRFGSLSKVFEMPEHVFFEHYASRDTGVEGIDSYYREWVQKDERLRETLPELPFTNRWIASQAAGRVPAGSILHVAILNSLRSWNYFPVDGSVDCFCNTGGFGIDGCMSAALGSALANPDRLVFEATGDLSFFYDMNSLGNRYVGANLRILLVNNGTGAEFHMPYSPASVMGDEVDGYVAAAGHFQNHFDASGMGSSTAAAWTQALGFIYLSARNKDEFMECADAFFAPGGSRPMILECFVDVHDEETAAGLMSTLDKDNSSRRKMVDAVKKKIPKGIKSAIKNAIS